MVLPHDCSQSKIANLDLSRHTQSLTQKKKKKTVHFIVFFFNYLTDVSINENVAAVEISMDDARIMSMEINQPFEYLLGPLLQSSHRHMSVLLPILSQVSRGTNLGDEVQSVAPLVSPDLIQGDDVSVLEALKQPDLRVEPLEHGCVVGETSQLDLVPSNFNAFFLVKGSVDFFDGA